MVIFSVRGVRWFYFGKARYFSILFLLCCTLLSRADAFSVCPFMNLTGLPCPGCGFTRAVNDLLHGHFHAAWQKQPFAIIPALLTLLPLIAPIIPSNAARSLYKATLRHLALLERIFFCYGILWLLYGFWRIASIVCGFSHFPDLQPDFMLYQLFFPHH